MTIYTAINHQVFTDEAKVFCVCQNHNDALHIAQALNDFESRPTPRAADGAKSREEKIWESIENDPLEDGYR